MINKIISIAVLLSLATPLLADEILLKEGKVIGGTILKEDAQEITIELGSKMVLRVARNKVARVTRSTPKKEDPILPNRPKVVTPKAPPPVPVVQPKSSAEAKTIKKENVSIERFVLVSTPIATKPDFADVTTTFRSSWAGAPEKEGDLMKWKWAVLRATIATTLPFYDGKPVAADIEAWNKFIRNAFVLTDGRVSIYTETLDSLAAELSQLRSKDEGSLRKETEALASRAASQAEKKRQGFERHEKRLFDLSGK